MAVTFTFGEGQNQIVTRMYRAKGVYPLQVKEYMITKGKELEQYMKSNHPWQNRTGNAERGLYVKYSESKHSYRQTLELSHGKDIYYGVYLEYAMERRFAIIEPTMRIMGPEIINDVSGMLGRFMGTT